MPYGNMQSSYKYRLALVGVSHRRFSADQRQQIAWTDAQIHVRVRDLLAKPWCMEAMVVATCYRLEVVALVLEVDQLHEWFLQQLTKAPSAPAYALHGADAFSHMLRVASGLDSKIQGETQVFGQYKQAFDQAKQKKYAGRYLAFLCAKLWYACKRVRGQSRIGQHANRLVKLVHQRMQPYLAPHKITTVLLIGAGKVIQDVLRCIKRVDGIRLVVLCRTPTSYDTIREVCLHAQVASVDDVATYVAQADVVISATSSKGIVVPVFPCCSVPALMMDLAMPHDIDPGWKAKGAMLFDIDTIAQGALCQGAELTERLQIACDVMRKEVARCYQDWLHYVHGSYARIAGFYQDVDRLLQQHSCPFLDDAARLAKDGGQGSCMVTACSQALHKGIQVTMRRYADAAGFVPDEMQALTSFEPFPITHWRSTAHDQSLNHSEIAAAYRAQLRAWVRRSVHDFVCQLRKRVQLSLPKDQQLVTV